MTSFRRRFAAVTATALVAPLSLGLLAAPAQGVVGGMAAVSNQSDPGDPNVTTSDEANLTNSQEKQLANAGPSVSAKAISVTSGTLAGFDPEFLLSDYQLDNKDSMTLAEIESFIASKGSACKPVEERTPILNADGTVNQVKMDDRAPCLKDVIHTVAADNLPVTGAKCAPMVPGDKTSAQVVYETAQACGINPQVLLVLLQKEQGLVTSLDPSYTNYNKATGANCPDTAACTTATLGFHKQVYTAASKFNQYRDPANAKTFPIQVGVTREIKFHPSAATLCPSNQGQTLTMRNAATAALYTYTPYVPNQAALDAVYLAADDPCSSYGNRNFFRLFNIWFTQPNLVERLAADDRYATAARISAAVYAPGVSVAYIASGESSIDALSVAPVAASLNAPVLLSSKGSLPASTAAELSRLQPQQIIVVGGPAVLSDAVVNSASQYGSVTRQYGENRYATAAAISAAAFPGGATTVYIASGVNPADALSAAPVAGSQNVPVLLTAPNAVPAETAAELARLQPTQIVIAGGTSAIATEVESQLTSSVTAATVGASAVAPSITRHAGADRYDTAVQIANSAGTTTGGTIFLASGTSSADALAIAPVAGMTGQPLLLTSTGQLPASTAAALKAASPLRITIIGGSAAVSDAVEGAIGRLFAK